ncbi:MAG: asparaginase [Oscillospiraceae bacterium]|nr:asparaginase [Oscillospiraceae bacterium]
MYHYENNKPKILVILTGGTICSSTNDEGQRYSNAENVKIIGHYQKSNSPFSGKVDFDKEIPLDTLSENMTVARWNTLLEALKAVNYTNYKGIIILHGTDTLAYTASLLAITLAGMPIPVCLVSSQLPLDKEGTNGHANFRAAVELIMNGIAPNVYAVYRNSDNIIYAHFGAQLLQCKNYSDDFFSRGMTPVSAENARWEGLPFRTNHLYLQKIEKLSSCVLKIVPYVGLDYNAFHLEGIRAIVHGTYHSQSVCVERSQGAGEYSSASILQLIDRCNEKDIPVFLAPCSPEAAKYESTGDAVGHGAGHICKTTNEMAYIKVLVGCALGLNQQALETFVNEDINNECIY